MAQFMENKVSDKNNELITAVRMALEINGTSIPKAQLISLAERALGRPLSAVERGVTLWRARDEFIKSHGLEIRSVRGHLSAATPAQSIDRRQRERSRAMRTLERSAERAARLAESDTISDSERKALQTAAEKANAMLVSASAEMRKRKRYLPGVD